MAYYSAFNCLSNWSVSSASAASGSGSAAVGASCRSFVVSRPTSAKTWSTTASLPEPEAAAEKDDTDALLRQLNAL